jgi:hypothetical protein
MKPKDGDTQLVHGRLMIFRAARPGVPAHWAFADKKINREVDRQNRREARSAK